MSESAEIGKIVKSDSHVRYLCQITGAGETALPPRPADFAFGRFVRMPVHAGPRPADIALLAEAGPTRSDALVAQPVEPGYAVGVICDTMLVNPAFGTLGPRLSNDEQVELFSPDYLSERCVLVTILLLGTMSLGGTFRQDGSQNGAGMRWVRHGVPPVAPELGAIVATMPEREVRAFHFFADGRPPGGAQPYLHMGYVPHLIAQNSPLLPMAILQVLEQLEELFPENTALLSIMQRNFAWRLKVQTTG